MSSVAHAGGATPVAIALRRAALIALSTPDCPRRLDVRYFGHDGAHDNAVDMQRRDPPR